MKKISSKVKLVYRLLFLILTLSLIVGGVCIFIFVKDYKMLFGLLYSIPAFFLILWTEIFYPSLFYKNYSYSYDKDRIFVNYGVIFKRKIIVPVLQLQDIHSLEGPLMQLFKLKTVMISTAGSNFIIQYMPIEDADKMVSELEGYLNNKLKEIED